MEIGSAEIGKDKPAYIIAEIGQNHNGDLYHAVRLIQMAESCNVDAVKLQARDAKYEFTEEKLSEPYIGRNSYGSTYRLHREKLDFGTKEFESLKDRHRYNQNKSELFTTVCSPAWIPWLEENDWCKFYKIASKDIRNIELISELAKTEKPLIISTGQAGSLEVIGRAVNEAQKHTEVALMHCVSDYPVLHEDTNLSAINTLRAVFGVPVGYSDHSAGVKAPVTAAIAYEADLIEVHVTKARAQRGTDHAASLEEPGLRSLVEWVRESEKMHGSGVIRPKITISQESESQNGMFL